MWIIANNGTVVNMNHVATYEIRSTSTAERLAVVATFATGGEEYLFSGAGDRCWDFIRALRVKLDAVDIVAEMGGELDVINAIAEVGGE